MCSYTSACSYTSVFPWCLLPAHTSSSSQTHSSTLPGPACTHEYPVAFLSPSHMCVGSLRILLGASLIHTHSRCALHGHTDTSESLLLPAACASRLHGVCCFSFTQRVIHHLSTIKPSFPVTPLTSNLWLSGTYTASLLVTCCLYESGFPVHAAHRITLRTAHLDRVVLLPASGTRSRATSALHSHFHRASATFCTSWWVQCGHCTSLCILSLAQVTKPAGTWQAHQCARGLSAPTRPSV